MAVIDAHHHLWDPSRATYPWLTDDLAAIRRAFTVDDLSPLLRQAGIDGSVVVQTRSSEDETRELLKLAGAGDVIVGVVGWVDLTAEDVDERLGALLAAPGGHRLVGIRHQAHDEADPAWLDREDVHRGVAAVGAAGLAYDLLVRTRELAAAMRLVHAQPGVRFVVDHAAKPPLVDGDLSAWEPAIRRLASSPNVTCKLSGLVTEADWQRWKVEDLQPAADVVIAAFGADRLLFGSDWPVSLLAAPYEKVFEAAQVLLQGFDDEGRAAVFGRTATRIYNLEV